MPIRLRPVELTTLDSVPVDAYAIFLGVDERPLQGLAGLLDWRMAAGISRHVRRELLTGEPGESFLITVNGSLPGNRLFAFGLGTIQGTNAEKFAAAARKAVIALQKAQVQSLAIGVPEQPAANVSGPLLAAALVPLGDIDISIFGPLGELSRALPKFEVPGHTAAPPVRASPGDYAM